MATAAEIAAALQDDLLCDNPDMVVGDEVSFRLELELDDIIYTEEWEVSSLSYR